MSRPEPKLKAGLFAISGNLIGSQETNIDLLNANGITITGNIIYSGHQRNLRATNSTDIVLSGNTFEHNADYLPRELATGITFDGCTDCSLIGSHIHDAYAGEHTVSTAAKLERKGLVELRDCRRMTVSACQILDPGLPGLHVENCSLVNVQGCSILDAREDQKMPHAVVWTGPGKANQIGNCTLGKGTGGAISATAESGLRMGENIEVDDA